jgi:hypothetical protein
MREVGLRQKRLPDMKRRNKKESVDDSKEIP